MPLNSTHGPPRIGLARSALLLALGMVLLVHAGLPVGHIGGLPSQCTTGLAPAITSKAAGSAGADPPVTPLFLVAAAPPARPLQAGTLPTRQLAPLADGPAAVFIQMLLL